MSVGKIDKFVAKKDAIFLIGDEKFRVETCNKSYSIEKLSDKNIRFEIREGDRVFPSDYEHHRDRSEISMRKFFGKKQTVDLTYELLIEEGTTFDSDWCCLGQWHADDVDGKGTPPPVAFHIFAGDKPGVILRKGEYGDVESWTPWKSSSAIDRASWHTIRMKTLFLRNSNGMAKVWFNGSLVVNYDGPLGYNTDNRWKHGIYRVTRDYAMAAKFRNFKIEAT